MSILNYLLISHGNFASGLLSSVEIILGKQDSAYAIDMYIDEETLEEKVKRVVNDSNINEQNLTILTDVFGGSVNQKVIKMFDMSKVKIITGMNLPMLLELFTVDSSQINDEKIKEIITGTRNQVIFVNEQLNTLDFEDDF